MIRHVPHSTSAGQVTPGLDALHALCDAQSATVPLGRHALDIGNQHSDAADFAAKQLLATRVSPSTFNDVEEIEDGADGEDDTEYFLALQRQINSGLVWRLQGSTGRAAMAAIEDGRCILGPDSGSDYYGNRIPSRYEVALGTKGSVGFASALWGQEYADTIDNA